MSTNPHSLPPAENRLHYPALDGWRTIALLLVFLQHYLHLPWGYVGVDLFFVLSGFLITGILFDSQHRPDRVRVFFVRRTLRIFPLYYAVFLLLAVLTPRAHFTWSAPWLLWPAYLGNYLGLIHPYHPSFTLHLASLGQLGMDGGFRKRLFLGHFWSLCVEEQFYLLWPWVVFGVRDRVRLLWASTGLVIVVLLARVLLRATLPGNYPFEDLLYKATPFRVDALLLGGMLALLLRGPARDLTLRAARWAAGLMGVVALAYWATHLHSDFPRWQFTWGSTYLDFFFAALLACALVPGNPVYRIGNLPTLRWLGRISYGMYVFHDIPHRFYYVAAAWLGTRSTLIAGHLPEVTALIALPCTFALAWLSFQFLESPFLQLKERWAPADSKRAPVPAAA